MYRPTVRYAEPFRDYVEELFKTTRLDRNQIMRLALYELGKSDTLKEFAVSPLPKSLSTTFSNAVWLSNTIEKVEVVTSGEEQGGGTSDVKEEIVPRQQGEVSRHQGALREEGNKQGTITFRIGNTVLLPR